MDDPVIHRIEALPPLRDVIAAHGLSAKKGLGQNFLLDINITRKIARTAGRITEGTVIEVGPGPGGLTRALLLEGASSVIALEKDERCLEALEPLVTAAGGRLKVISADATRVDVTTLGPGPIRIVANLPYNVATPLLVSWIGQAEKIASMTLMFQREVAERIVASPGDKAYGRLSVLANWRCDTRIEYLLPARAFTPPPKVDSAVVRLDPFPQVPYPCNAAVLEKVTAAAFGQRRKMLRGSLKSLCNDPVALLETAGLDPTARAEDVDVEGFARLARVWEGTGD